MYSLNCYELFRKRNFATYSEFYLAMVIAAECGRRGGYLNMKGMKVNTGILSKSLVTFFKYLKQEGYIKTENQKEEPIKIDPEDVQQYFDTSYITDNLDVLVEERKDSYVWDYDWCNNNYVKHRTSFLNLGNFEKVVMYITATTVVRMIEGEIPKKPLVLKFRGHIAKTIYNYINVYSCVKTLPWFNELVEVDTDTKADLDYYVFWNEGSVSGKNKLWSISEKKGFMEELGMQEESVVILWTRKGMVKSNPGGKIESATVGIIKEIGRDFIEMDTIALNKTKEEVRQDYYSIPEDLRNLYTDLLNFKPVMFSKNLQLTSLGIENYMDDESQFISLINPTEKVNKIITINGKEVQREMRCIDAIYWLLCQYEIDFDRELYKAMYNEGKDLLWDEFGEE